MTLEERIEQLEVRVNSLEQSKAAQEIAAREQLDRLKKHLKAIKTMKAEPIPHFSIISPVDLDAE